MHNSLADCQNLQFLSQYRKKPQQATLLLAAECGTLPIFAATFKLIQHIIFEYQGLADEFFIVLYRAAAFSALLMAVYVLWWRGNAFAPDVGSSRVLRCRTAAFMAAVA